LVEACDECESPVRETSQPQQTRRLNEGRRRAFLQVSQHTYGSCARTRSRRRAMRRTTTLLGLKSTSRVVSYVRSSLVRQHIASGCPAGPTSQPPPAATPTAPFVNHHVHCAGAMTGRRAFHLHLACEPDFVRAFCKALCVWGGVCAFRLRHLDELQLPLNPPPCVCHGEPLPQCESLIQLTSCRIHHAF
jgi:hypothetical protein